MWIALGAVGFVLLIFIIIYNSLVTRKNDCENAFAGIDVQLQKRHDLIPNLVSAVKGYMKHEAGVLTKLTELRAQVQNKELGTDDRVQLENEITKNLGGIMIAVENYPDLKASQNVDMLMRSLNEVEEQLAAARRAFNAAVTSFNNGVETFPSSIIAGMFGFRRRTMFEIPTAARPTLEQAPEINLG